MNKIIPILSIIAAVMAFTVSVIAIITVSIAVQVPQLKLVAAPTAVIGTVLSVLFGGTAALLTKSKLCRVALIINIAALILSVIALCILLLCVG